MVNCERQELRCYQVCCLLTLAFTLTGRIKLCEVVYFMSDVCCVRTSIMLSTVLLQLSVVILEVESYGRYANCYRDTGPGVDIRSLY